MMQKSCKGTNCHHFPEDCVSKIKEHPKKDIVEMKLNFLFCSLGVVHIFAQQLSHTLLSSNPAVQVRTGVHLLKLLNMSLHILSLPTVNIESVNTIRLVTSKVINVGK